MRQHMIGAVAAAALALGSVSAQAAFVDVDLAGWQTVGGFAASGNTEVFLDIGIDSVVTGFDYIDLAFATQGTSWLSEFTLSVNNSDASEYIDLAPSTADNTGVFGPASGSWNAVDGFGAADFAVADGTIWVTVYEAFNDSGTDALVSQGTLRVFYDVAPIPEPGTYALMALGLAGVAAAARRRKA